MTGGIAGIHQMLGGLVVVALIVVAILAAFQAAGRSGDATRIASYVAGALLVLQYVLGFLLLGSNFRNSNEHYVIALLILVPIGLQHTAARRLSPQTRGISTMIWALAAAFVSVIAYMTGMWGTAAVAS